MSFRLWLASVVNVDSVGGVSERGKSSAYIRRLQNAAQHLEGLDAKIARDPRRRPLRRTRRGLVCNAVYTFSSNRFFVPVHE